MGVGKVSSENGGRDTLARRRNDAFTFLPRVCGLASPSPPHRHPSGDSAHLRLLSCATRFPSGDAGDCPPAVKPHRDSKKRRPPPPPQMVAARARAYAPVSMDATLTGLCSRDTSSRARAARALRDDVVGAAKSRKSLYVRAGVVPALVAALNEAVTDPTAGGGADVAVPAAAAVGALARGDADAAAAVAAAGGLDALLAALADGGALPGVAEAGARGLKLALDGVSEGVRGVAFSCAALTALVSLLAAPAPGAADVAARVLAAAAIAGGPTVAISAVDAGATTALLASLARGSGCSGDRAARARRPPRCARC